MSEQAFSSQHLALGSQAVVRSSEVFNLEVTPEYRMLNAEC